MSNPAIVNGAALLGRVLLSIIFITSGWAKLAGFAGTVGFFTKIGLPMPTVAAIVAIVVELGGGLLVLAGYRTREAGAALAAFCVATAFIAHANFGDQNQMIHFWKNIAIAGGFLQLVAFGAGAWSAEAYLARQQPAADA